MVQKEDVAKYELRIFELEAEMEKKLVEANQEHFLKESELNAKIKELEKQIKELKKEHAKKDKIIKDLTNKVEYYQKVLKKARRYISQDSDNKQEI